MFSSVLFFALFFLWTIDHRGSFDTFSIQKSVICTDVDKTLLPCGVGEVFDFGVRQLCLWLQHDGGRCGDRIRFFWYFRDQLVHQESCVLSGEENYNLFYLMRVDGSALPVGGYQVKIKINNRFVNRTSFRIINSEASVIGLK